MGPYGPIFHHADQDLIELVFNHGECFEIVNIKKITPNLRVKGVS